IQFNHQSILLKTRVLETAVPHATWSGVARQPLTFFASSKKVSKERRPRRLAPAGFPFARRKKWEMSETRLRLRQRTFLIHFLRRANGCVSSGKAWCDRRKSNPSR